MAETDPTFLIEAEAVAQFIDELDYFQILKIEQNAKPQEVKLAYFRESRVYHPDQFFRMEAGPGKQAIGKIYKRVNEAWVVLRDDTKRAKYIADISGPEREKKLLREIRGEAKETSLEAHDLIEDCLNLPASSKK